MGRITPKRRLFVLGGLKYVAQLPHGGINYIGTIADTKPAVRVSMRLQSSPDFFIGEGSFFSFYQMSK